MQKRPSRARTCVRAGSCRSENPESPGFFVQALNETNPNPETRRCNRNLPQSYLLWLRGRAALRQASSVARERRSPASCGLVFCPLRQIESQGRQRREDRDVPPIRGGVRSQELYQLATPYGKKNGGPESEATESDVADELKDMEMIFDPEDLDQANVNRAVPKKG